MDPLDLKKLIEDLKDETKGTLDTKFEDMSEELQRMVKGQRQATGSKDVAALDAGQINTVVKANLDNLKQMNILSKDLEKIIKTVVLKQALEAEKKGQKIDTNQLEALTANVISKVLKRDEVTAATGKGVFISRSHSQAAQNDPNAQRHIKGYVHGDFGKNFDNFFDKLTGFLLNKWAEKDEKDKTRTRRFVGELVDSLGKSKWIGGAFMDFIKLITYMGASWLRKFGTLGKILGVALIAAGPFLASSIWSLVSVGLTGLISFLSTTFIALLKTKGGLAIVASVLLGIAAKKEWDQGNKGEAVGLGLASLGAAIIGIAAMLAPIATALGIVAEIFPAVAGIASVLSGIVGLLTPIGAIAIAVGALVFLVTKFWDPISKWFVKLYNFIVNDMLKGFWEGTKDFVLGIGDWFSSIASSLDPIKSALAGIFKFSKSTNANIEKMNEKLDWRRVLSDMGKAIFDAIKHLIPGYKDPEVLSSPTGSDGRLKSEYSNPYIKTSEADLAKYKGEGVDKSTITKSALEVASTTKARIDENTGAILNFAKMSKEQGQREMERYRKEDPEAWNALYEVVPADLVDMAQFRTDLVAPGGKGVYAAKGTTARLKELRAKAQDAGYSKSQVGSIKLTGGIGSMGSYNKATGEYHATPHVASGTLKSHHSMFGGGIDISASQISASALASLSKGVFGGIITAEGDHVDIKQGVNPEQRAYVTARENLRIEQEKLEKQKKEEEEKTKTTPAKDPKELKKNQFLDKIGAVTPFQQQLINPTGNDVMSDIMKLGGQYGLLGGYFS